MKPRHTNRMISGATLFGTFLAADALLLSVMPYLGKIGDGFDAFSSFLPLALLLGCAGLAIGLYHRQPRIATCCILALGIALSVIIPEFRRNMSLPSPDATGFTITLVTHNVAVGNIQPTETLRMLGATNADIILLQEMRGKVGAMLPDLYDIYPYHSRCLADCDLAILSKFPLDSVRWKLRDDNGIKVGPPLIWTRVHPPHGPAFTLATIHLPWPFPPGSQAEWRKRLVGSAALLGKDNAILAGDFNLTPWSAAMRVLDDKLRPMRRITAHLFSFPARVAGHAFPAPLLPIDHIFIGPAWRVVKINRLPRSGSDHYPVRAILRLDLPPHQ